MKVTKIIRILPCILMLDACTKKRIERINIPVENYHTSKNNETMKIIKLKLGEQTSIELHNIIEYTWYYETKPNWIISMVEEYSAPFKAIGTTNEEQANNINYTIKTLKKGEVIVRFYAIKAWEKDAKPFEEVFYKIIIE